MALLICDECKGRVSDKAATCPHCGAPVIKPAKAPPVPPAPPKPKEPQAPVTFWDCFFQSFVKPGPTVRRILDQKPGYGVRPFLLLMSLLEASRPLYIHGFKVALGNLGESIAAALICMTGFFYLVNWVGIWGDSLLGKAFGGKANLQEVSTAYVWAGPPYLVGVLIDRATEIPLWGREFTGNFTGPTFDSDPVLYLMLSFLGLLPWIFYIWSVVATIFNMAEAQRFHIGLAVATVLLASLPQGLLMLVTKIFHYLYITN